jgi:hypothetical protein
MTERPYTVTAEKIAYWKQYGPQRCFPFPNWDESGRHAFRGYTRVATWFVDSSGFGAPGEPALTVEEFIDRLRPGSAYAIVGVGQFQVYVAEFEKNKRRA